MPKESYKADIKNYINMAKHGHYPLFCKTWLQGFEKDTSSMKLKAAKKDLEKYFKSLSRHRTVNKKQTAILGLNEQDRSDFIQSFIKVLEHESLKEHKLLH